MADPGRLDELKRKFDENPKRYFAPLANEYRKAGNADLAIELCRTYLPQQPNHMSGYIVYGQALHDAGQAEESAAVFKQALSLDPENIIALRHLGDISRNAGDNVGAMRWYGKVLELDPRNEEVSAFLASLAAPGTKAFAPPATSERQAPPTIRPEPAPDASAVRLEDIVSQPDVAQTPYSAEEVSEEESVDVESEQSFETTSDEPFEVTSWPTATDTPVSGESNPVIEGPWHASVETGSEQESGYEGDQNTEEPAPLRFSDFMPEEDAAFAPTAEELGDVAAETTPDPVPIAEAAPETPSQGAGDDERVSVADAPESVPHAAAEAETTAAAETHATAAHDGSPFVTETMAELYISQGLEGEALVIYRQLVLKRDDPALRQRIVDLEASQARAAVRETVRAFFARIGARRPDERVEMGAERGSSLGALFGAAQPDTNDVSAAQRLSSAFGNSQSGASRS